MKTVFLTTALSISCIFAFAQSTFVSKNVKADFFSKTAIEDISAKNTTGTSVYLPNKGDIQFSLGIKAFTFPIALMQEHFNENYMESDKFPTASFKGKLDKVIDLSKDGEYDVKATGKLLIHGVEKDRIIDGKVIVKNGIPSMTTSFKVKCVDHDIDIPKIVTAKIAESLDVNVATTYSVYKSK